MSLRSWGLALCAGTTLCPAAPQLARQNPSPMREATRTHERVKESAPLGVSFTVDSLLPKRLDVYVPRRWVKARAADLLVHFHGAPFIVRNAVENSSGPIIGMAVNLGGGSQAYQAPFVDSTTFLRLLNAVRLCAETKLGHPVRLRRVVLSAFSAGYGAVRRILRDSANYARVNAVMLLDGIHASYVPEGRLLADGGAVDSTQLATFTRLAEESSRRRSRKRFLITHSEIFPGTYASTTESTDDILAWLHLRRSPVLRWGPHGMQQLSTAGRGRFAVWGFAGNAAQDHVDHLHALGFFLRALFRL